MASPRSLSHDLHVNVRPLEDNETEEKKSVVTLPVSGLDPQIRKDLFVYAWDSMSVFACGSSFVLMFYLREDMHKTGVYGYELQNLFEALISIAAVYPFALKARFVNGENHSEAIRKMARAIPVYLPLNGLFQPTKDTCVAMNVSRSFINFVFVEYGNAVYEPMEALSALLAYGGGFSLAFALLSKLMRLPVTTLDILKAGQQYYLSYLIGALFNTDLTVGVSRLPNVFYSGLVLAGANFIFDVLTDRVIMQALRNHYCVARPVITNTVENEVKEAEASVLEASADRLAVTVDSQRESLLSAEELAAAQDESPRGNRRWNKSCYEILKSYCLFWSKPTISPVHPSVSVFPQTTIARYKK